MGETQMCKEEIQKTRKFMFTSLKQDMNNEIERIPAQVPSMRFGLATATKGTVWGEAEFARLAVNRRPNRIRKPARFVKFVFDIRIQVLHTYHTNFLQTYDLNSGISPMRGPADPEKEIADFSWIKYNKKFSYT